MIRNALQQADHAEGVLHCVWCDVIFFSRPAVLAVPPLGLGELNVCTVAEHDVRKRYRRRSHIDWATEAVRIQQRQISGMVDVRVRDQYKIKLGCRDRNRLVFINIRSLLHTAVH